MPNVWTIHHGDVTGGPTKSDLYGCRITTNDGGTAYVLMKGNDLLSSSTNNGSLPAPPFSFVDFGLDTYTWTLTVTTLTGGPSSNQAQGTWINDAPDPTAEQSGTFTAQAGSEVGGDDGEDRGEDKAAASA
jgi:hypothetical protein